MKINEYGTQNEEAILMFPPLGCRSNVYDFVRPELEKKYHLLVVGYQGVESDLKADFTSVEEIVEEVENWLLEKKMDLV